MSTLGLRMSELVRACFTGICIKSYEPEEPIAELAQLCRVESWSLMTWDTCRARPERILVDRLTPVNGPRLGPYHMRSKAISAEIAWLREFWLEPAIQSARRILGLESHLCTTSRF